MTISPLRPTAVFGSSLFLISVLLGTAEPRVRAEDWPQWRGPFRTGAAGVGDAGLDRLPEQLRVLWRREVGGGFASPVVAGGHVAFLDDQAGHETVHLLDALTGREVWEAELDLSHRDGFGIGPRCTPLMDGDRVYAQSAKGELRCLSRKDGRVVWRTNYVEDFGAVYIGEKGKAAGASRHGASGSPLVDGDLLIAQVGSEKGASVVAFHKTTGAVQWKSQNDQSAYAGLFRAAMVGGAQVLSFTAEGLIGLSPEDGRLLWRVPFKTALGRHVTTPVVSGSLALVASHQIGLVASRITPDGKGAWSATEAWSNRALGFNFSSPVVVGEHLYGLAPGKKVVCVALETGQVVWEQEGLIQTSSDKAEAAFLVFKDRILMLNDTGELVMFHSDPTKYREVGRLQVCGKTWCNPAYANGRLYVRDEKELVCVDLKPE